MKVFALLLLIWEGLGRFFAVKPYILPLPSQIFSTIYTEQALLLPALMQTASMVLLALALSVVFALVLASLMSFFKQFRELTNPIITLLQVTPLVALIPLLLIYFDGFWAMLFAAVLIAFVPLLTALNAAFSMKNADLEGLFTLFKASSLQKYRFLQLPFAFSRLREMLPLTANLALVGVVVGEFTASRGGGLAYLMMEAQYRLNNARLYACLLLIAGFGLFLHFVMVKLSKVTVK